MTTVYIIGSNSFNDLKGNIYDSLISQKDVKVSAVGFSENFDHVLKNKDYEALHALEDKAIEEADIIILIDSDEIFGKRYVGEDTYRELKYCKLLNKTVITSDMLFQMYLKKKV